MRVAYIAYPIDAAKAGHWLQLVTLFVEQLRANQSVGVIYDPGGALTVANFNKIEDRAGFISEINALALFRSDVVFAFIPEGVETIGVPMEIERAVAMQKRVIVFTDREVAFMLQNPGIEVVPLTVESIEDAAKYFADVPSPAKETDTQPLPFKLLDSDARIPTKAHGDDAGFDLYTTGFHVIQPGEFVDIPVGVAVELPSYLWGLLTGRSSTWRDMRLNVINGVIDPGYRGPLFVGVHNPTDQQVTIDHHRRLAQLILMGNPSWGRTAVQVETLNPAQRGHNGFGSSGS